MHAKAHSGRSSLSANQTTSFFFVSVFGSGAYSAKLFRGTRQRFSGFNQPRQCGDEVADIGDWRPAWRSQSILYGVRHFGCGCRDHRRWK
jgi:hypothetical protein